MIGYSIELEGIEEQIAALKRFPVDADERLYQAMQKSVITVRSNILPLVPVGVSARLKNSIGSEVIHEGYLSIVGKIGSSLKDEVYPSVMEFGRKPGTMPPVDSLIRWVHLKIKPPAEKEYAVAFAIARKIQRQGIKAREFMKEGWEKSRFQVNEFFAKALEQIAEDLSNGRQ